MILARKLSVLRDPPLTCMSVSTTSPCFPWIALWLSTNKNLAAVLIFCPRLDNLGTMLFATVWSSSVSVLWFSLLCNSPSYAMYAFSNSPVCPTHGVTRDISFLHKDTPWSVRSASSAHSAFPQF